MPHPFHVHVVALDDDHDIPGRFADSGLIELAEALGHTPAEDEDAWAALATAFKALPATDLAERLLDLVLLKPPIPAGCEALVVAMKDADTPPWLTHEVREDRVWLWYCHRLLHAVFPDTYPEPTICRTRLQVTMLTTDGRPPGKRAVAHDRTAFVAHLLQHRSGDNPLAHTGASDDSWAYDAIWAVEIGERTKTAEATLLERGAPADVASSGKAFELTLDVWMPQDSLGDLAADQAWAAEA